MLDLINIIRNGPPKRPPKRPPVASTRERKPRGTRKPWTGQDIATLKDMAGKHSAGEIAKHLGRTPNAVAQRAHQLGISLSLREFDPGIIDAARVLHDAGYTTQQIISMFEIGSEKAKRIRMALEV